MTTRTLRLAKDLTLPLDAVTQTFLIVGKRGSGKSNTAARFVEQLHHARLPFVVLDPVDTWWGLKAGRDGSKGLDVYVFGGRKADLPLEAGGGALIAEVLCEHRLSMVLSVKHLSGRERSTFMVAFARTLFQKWGGGPLHVVLEEAHELAPQTANQGREGEQEMLGAFKRLWKLGRSSGIGGTAVTQRPASLSKDITTQSEILIAHRTIGPQDVKAVGEWVKYHGERLDILAELPTLPTGEAFVWAPEFPEGKPIGLQRSTILLRETYDSASTPKVGEQRVEPKELADVDLERLRVKMAATIEKAKADDPRELRKQIAELKKQLSSTPIASPPERKTVSTPVLTDADRAMIEKLAKKYGDLENVLLGDPAVLFAEYMQNVEQHLKRTWYAFEGLHQTARREFAKSIESKGFQKILDKLATIPPPPLAGRSGEPTPRPRPTPAARAGLVTTSGNPSSNGKGDASIGKCERAILTVLAQQPDGCESGKLTLLTRYRYSGGFKNSLSMLRQAGFIVGENTGTMQITSEGLRALGPVDPLPTGADLARYWLTHSSFGRCETAILTELLSHPKGLTAEQLCERTNYQYSGGFKNSLSVLRTAGVIVGRNTEVMRASEELF